MVTREEVPRRHKRWPASCPSIKAPLFPMYHSKIRVNPACHMSLSSVTTDSKAMSIAKNGVPQPRSTLPSTSPHLVVLRHAGVKPCKSLRR